MNTKVIELMKNYYNEKEDVIKSYVDMKLNSNGEKNIMNTSFIIFTDEAFVMNQANDILDKIIKIGGKILGFIYYPGIDEYMLVQHYKYHNPRPNAGKEIYSYASTIPSIGWPMVRKRFGKPLIACILLGEDENFNTKMFQLKGNNDSTMCTEKQIRYSALNRVYTLLHSSDDVYSAIREAILFFGEEEYLKLVNSDVSQIKNLNQLNEKMIRLYADIRKKNAILIDDILEKIRYKLCWFLIYENLDKIKQTQGLEDNVRKMKINNLNEFIKNFEFFKNFKEDNDWLEALKITELNSGSIINVQKIMKKLNEMKVFDTEWEQNSFESELLLKFLEQENYF